MEIPGSLISALVRLLESDMVECYLGMDGGHLY